MTDQTARDKLVHLVTQLVNADFEGGEDAKDALVFEIETMVPAAHAIDLIYFSDDDNTPEMSVDKMLGTRPIALPGHSQT
jgi:hypothetical protein